MLSVKKNEILFTEDSIFLLFFEIITYHQSKFILVNPHQSRSKELLTISKESLDHDFAMSHTKVFVFKHLSLL